ncbi:MAG: tetratricopeptide repeat protein [Prochlorotrichaceae cyanobacterium]
MPKFSGFLLFSAIVLGGWSSVQAQTSPAEPTDYRPLAQESSILSIQGGNRLIQEAGAAISNQNYLLAQQKLQDARQVFNQLSNFYQDLAATFVGINSQVSENQRQRAIDTAQRRDEATFQLALVHRAQNQPELSVPLLIQVIRSQSPTSPLGQQAYQELFELGFVEVPFAP